MSTTGSPNSFRAVLWRNVRILFIHEVNYRNKVIFEMHEFPELLALRGHDVTFFHYPEAPDSPKISLRTQRERVSGRAYPEAELELITPPTFGGGVFERYIAPVLNFPALKAELSNGNYDVVVLYAVPTTGWQTVALAKQSGIPVVFRALDVSHKIRSNIFSGLIRMAERYIYRNATVVSANNPAMAEYCIAESRRTLPTVVDLPPVDLSHFGISFDRDLRAELSISDSSRVVLYMGSFFGFSGLDIVMRALKPYLESHPELVFVLVGGGDLDGTLRALAREMKIEQRVVFTGIVPYVDLPGYLKLADVAINPFIPQLLTDVAFPHKVLQYMAAGIPTVSTSLRGLRGVLGDDCGVVWVKDPVEVAQTAVELALGDASFRRARSKAGQAFVTEVFSRESAVLSFERTLKSVG